VGAGEANGGHKPPASRPSLRPNATKATGPNPVPTDLSELDTEEGVEADSVTEEKEEDEEEEDECSEDEGSEE
jgi:hypothetical protein